MICLNIFYQDSLQTILEISKEKTVFEIKALISSALDYEFSDFFLYLGDYGFIDGEDFMELPLVTFGLQGGKVYSIFAFNIYYLDKLWRLCCTEKIIGNSPITQVGYLIKDGDNEKFKSTFQICHACSVYCHPSSGDGELILENNFSCMCALPISENKARCKFEDCRDLSTYLDVDDKNYNLAFSNVNSVLTYHAEKVFNREKSRIDQLNKEILARSFDFERSVRFGMQRIKMYEMNDIKQKVISHIPIEDLKKESLENSLTSKLDYKDEFVKSLLKWFKKIFFTWCDKPICSNCNIKSSNFIETEPPNDEEQKWLASRTEVYFCNTCNKAVRFPRYNNPEKLCNTKTGRCGEWANLFGCILRCLNYEARFVDNFEDHVWNEYYSESLKRWIHVDSCEAAWDTPLIYEQGWGRNLTFILAFSAHGVYDVTRRYVKDWDLIESRRKKTEVESMSAIVTEHNNNLRGAMDPDLVELLASRDMREQAELLKLKTMKEEEFIGRQSGSEDWRKNRGEFK